MVYLKSEYDEFYKKISELIADYNRASSRFSKLQSEWQTSTDDVQKKYSERESYYTELAKQAEAIVKTIGMSNIDDIQERPYNADILSRIAKQINDLSVYKQQNDRAEAEYQEHLKKIDAVIQRISVFVSLTENTRVKEPGDPRPYDESKLIQLASSISNSTHDLFSTLLYTEATGQLKTQLRIKDDLLLQLNQKKQALKKQAFDDFEENYREAAGQLKTLKRLISQLKPQMEAEYRQLTEKYGLSIFDYQDDKENKLNCVSAYLQSPCSNKLSSDYRIIRNNFAHLDSLPSTQFDGNVVIGDIFLPLPVLAELESLYIDTFGDQFDPQTQSLRLPFSIDVNTGRVIIVNYKESQEKNVLSVVQNLALAFSCQCGEHAEPTQFLNPAHLYVSELEKLVKEPEFAGSGLFSPIATTYESTTKALRELNDELTELGVRCNPRLTVLHSLTDMLEISKADIELVQQICAKAKEAGLTFVITLDSDMLKEQDANSGKRFQFLYRQDRLGLESCYIEADKKTHKFEWYCDDYHIPAALRQIAIARKNSKELKLVNLYSTRIGFDWLPTKKGNRRIPKIPIGIDARGKIYSIDFNDDNFAAYICGTTRVGKSVLLHTIINGLLKSTHPDDIEIWLIDYKKMEFSRYITEIPPQVKYVVLDQSPELVFDVIDSLHKRMEDRQNFFKGKWEKHSDIPSDVINIPAVFVIIDEFSIMSQIIASSDTDYGKSYRDKVESLLKLGGATGFYFIFSSQSFSDETRGMNSDTQAQIHQRISLQANESEIRAVLSLNSGSEQDNKLIRHLAPHYCLVKERVPNEKGDYLTQLHVLYIDHKEDQINMIRDIKNYYGAENRYSINNSQKYRAKEPRFFDGMTPTQFSDVKLRIRSFIDSNEQYLEKGDVYLFPGQALRLEKMEPLHITNEYCSNLLVVSPLSEKMPTCAAFQTIVESCKMQNYEYEFWGTPRDSFLREIRAEAYNASRTYIDLEDICQRIHEIAKNIREKIEGRMIISIFSLDSLFTDFSFQESATWEDNKKENEVSFSGSVVIEGREEGELDLISQLEALDEHNEPKEASGSVVERQNMMDFDDDTTHKQAYDAREDIKFIFKNGPKYGYHIILHCGSANDVMQLRIDTSLFKHRLMTRASLNDAHELFGIGQAGFVTTLEKHVFRYTNGLDQVSYRPFIYPNYTWDEWFIENGRLLKESKDNEII